MADNNEIDRIHNRIDRLDDKVTHQIDDLRGDLQKWMAGDNEHDGLTQRVRRIEDFQKRRRHFEYTTIAAVMSTLSGIVTYVVTIFSSNPK